MSGVYQIYNPINNKRYIGSSINVERRLKEHLRNLKKNTHCNVHLQSAYNKYKDVLQFQFLEECEPDECLIFEQYYLDYITNPYLRYLADPGNTYTTKELRDAGFHSAARNKRYLLNPIESKSHMLTLKRALKDSNKISKWSDPVDENMILDYFRSGRANGAVRNQYDLYIDKQRYIDRLNRLVPMEWLLPTIGLGGAEFLREKQNNKSN